MAGHTENGTCSFCGRVRLTAVSDSGDARICQDCTDQAIGQFFGGPPKRKAKKKSPK